MSHTDLLFLQVQDILLQFSYVRREFQVFDVNGILKLAGKAYNGGNEVLLSILELLLLYRLFSKLFQLLLKKINFAQLRFNLR